MPTPANPFELVTVGDVDIVRVKEAKMAYPALEALQAELCKRIDAGARKMVINLAPVLFVDSFGLGVIVATSRRMQKNAGQLRLCGVGDRVKMSLTITRLDRTLDIVADEAEAIRSLSGEA